ncbi:MobB mobilization protein (plasmid) [Paraburkholderia sp. A2RO-4L]|uniref:plasmid mobilization protein n=1 Tax=Paraburkholderia sp. A2RO-4L TaxID=3028374 RepID=UPI003DA86FE8
MPFQKSAVEPLDAVINVRLPTSEKVRIKEDADSAAISVSALVRRRYFGRPIIANTDDAMIKEVRRLGGLLKHIHNQSRGTYSQATAEALRAVTAYIERLSRDRKKG